MTFIKKGKFLVLDTLKHKAWNILINKAHQAKKTTAEMSML